MDTESEISSQLISGKGGKRKIYSMEFKKDVIKYTEKLTNMIRVSRKLVMFKAKSIYDEKLKSVEIARP